MPMTSGIPLGLLIIAAGAVLLLVRKSRKIAAVVIGIGILITTVTLILTILVVNSQM